MPNLDSFNYKMQIKVASWYRCLFFPWNPAQRSGPKHSGLELWV